MKKSDYSFWARNSLSIVVLALFVLSWIAQALTGWAEHNAMRADAGAVVLPFLSYLRSGHFVQATFENWESEFLQMFLYVLLTIKLRQWGSSESKPFDKEEAVDRAPDANRPGAPWPVRKGGLVLKLYQNSLSLAFLILFLMSWAAHAYGSFRDYNVEQALQGKPADGFIAFLGAPRFWFESFQNWQSEFLSVAGIVILSIFLRQQGSPESKPVDAANDETGE